MKKTSLAIFIILVVFATGLGMGFFYGKSQVPDFSLFWEARQVLEKYYVDPERIDYQQMLYGAIRGMTESLDDPYTVFMAPEDLKIFEEDTAGEFQGVGMEIGIRDDQLTVIAPLGGAPAERAGLKPGDKILKIDDRETKDMVVDMAVKLIRGPKGSKVVLTIMRAGWSEPKEFAITRDVILIPALSLEIIEGNIAHIKLYDFSRIASSEFNEVAKEILSEPSEKIILDLRNNPGGFLDEAQEIAGWFLEKGDIVTTEQISSGKTGEVYKADGPAKLLPYPTVILVNQGSASASEILAGALRDNRGIKLIGEKTFGKGSIQTLEELSEGGIKITIARWLTPDGYLIDNIGLESDIIVELTDEDIEADRDPQLDRAIAYFNTDR